MPARDDQCLPLNSRLPQGKQGPSGARKPRLTARIRPSGSDLDLQQAGKLRPALGELLEAHEYARDARRDAWDFAVEIARLKQAGLNWNDLRWLVCKQYVRHAREIPLGGEPGRRFRDNGELTFSRQTCFVLTDAGVAFARSQCAAPGMPTGAVEALADENGSRHDEGQEPLLVPCWDPQQRQLRVGDGLVKHFKLPAPNQEAILAAFQEEGWPIRVDDPLTCQAGHDPKRRLNDTITSLNRNQKIRLLRFKGDGTGEGILWELAPFSGPAPQNPPPPRLPRWST